MPRTLDLDECAALLKVCTNTVAELAATGDLPGAKIGRAWVFIEDDVVDYLRDQVRIQVERRRSAQGSKVVAYFVAPKGRGRRKPLPRLPELPPEIDSSARKPEVEPPSD